MATKHDQHPDEPEVAHDLGQKMVHEEHHREALEELKEQQGLQRRKAVRHQPSPEPVREHQDNGGDDSTKPEAS